MWYYAYKIMYPTWSSNITYAYQKQPLLDWKYLSLKLQKQKSFIKSNKFQLESILSKQKSTSIPPNYQIQEPFVSDIDPITNTGMIAVSKYCKYTRHKILFYHYPSYELIRKFELQFQISDVFEWSCQIIGIQTLEINKEKIRLFAVSLNQPRVMTDSDDEEDQPQRDELQSLWKVILIYRLHDDGSTTCLSHLETSSLFLGRGTFFFNTIGSGVEDTKKWLQITSPDTLEEYDSNHSVFMLAYGLSLTRFAGYSQVIQLDLRANETLLDPSKTVYAWDDEEDRFVISKKFVNKAPQQQSAILSPTTNATNGLYSSPESSSSSTSSLFTNQDNRTRFSAQVISTLYLGPRVSCMIHFQNPTQLNHLIITGNFHRNELSIYDWRFGLNVGVFPHSQQQGTAEPWGFESGWAIPPPPTTSEQDMILYGPRLIVVGDGQDKFEIKIWDISQLLRVKWDPFSQEEEDEHNSLTAEEENESESQAMVYLDWWNRKTRGLKQVALNGYLNKMDLLPYTIPQEALKKTHTLNAQVKYTAFINLQTWSYLLREDGHLSVMDIESGEILKIINMNGIAEDVNVVGDKEIIVTRKDELLRSLLP